MHFDNRSFLRDIVSYQPDFGILVMKELACCMPNQSTLFIQLYARRGHNTPFEIAQILGQSCTSFGAFSVASMATNRQIIWKTVLNYPITARNRVPLTSYTLPDDSM
jgi:hypothetical protein